MAKKQPDGGKDADFQLKFIDLHKNFMTFLEKVKTMEALQLQSLAHGKGDFLLSLIILDLIELQDKKNKA